MAHGFLQSFDANLTVCSAGTKASGKLNPKTVEVMKEAGVYIRFYILLWSKSIYNSQTVCKALKSGSNG